jgi:hypothetical protein
LFDENSTSSTLRRTSWITEDRRDNFSWINFKGKPQNRFAVTTEPQAKIELTTDNADFTDGCEQGCSIRVIRAIRGQS